jgi:hypothetical protein
MFLIIKPDKVVQRIGISNEDMKDENTVIQYEDGVFWKLDTEYWNKEKVDYED